MRELDRRRDVDRLDVDLQQRHIADPGFVFDLDGVVAEADDEIGRAQQLALHLPAGALDAAERKRMLLVDQAFGHGGGGERQIEMLDHLAQLRGIAKPHGRRADDRDRPSRGGNQFGGARDRFVRSRRQLARRRERRHRLVGRCERDVLGQIEMHRTLRLAQRKPDRLRKRRADLALAQRQRRLGDRLEQRMMIDPHLNAAAELIGIEIAGNGDERRAVEPGVADAGREIGRARPQRGDAKARRAGEPAGDVGGKAGGALMGGEHEIDAALAHRLHQRQHVAARNAEAARNSG